LIVSVLLDLGAHNDRDQIHSWRHVSVDSGE